MGSTGTSEQYKRSDAPGSLLFRELSSFVGVLLNHALPMLIAVASQLFQKDTVNSSALAWRRQPTMINEERGMFAMAQGQFGQVACSLSSRAAHERQKLLIMPFYQKSLRFIAEREGFQWYPALCFIMADAFIACKCNATIQSRGIHLRTLIYTAYNYVKIKWPEKALISKLRTTSY